MLDDAILLGDPATFDQLMQVCADIEGKINRTDVLLINTILEALFSLPCR